MARWIIAGIVLGTQGCAYALHPHTTLAGRPFPVERVNSIAPGSTQPEVMAVIGEPFQVSEAEGTVIWSYFERYQPRGCTGLVLGIIPTSSRQVHSVAATVFFREGRVRTVALRRE